MYRSRLRNTSGEKTGNNPKMRLPRHHVVSSTPKDQSDNAMSVGENGNTDFVMNSPSTISDGSLVAVNSYVTHRRNAHAFENDYEAVYAEKVVVHTIENIIGNQPALLPFPFRSRQGRTRWPWLLAIPLLLLIPLGLWCSPIEVHRRFLAFVSPVSSVLPLNRTVEIVSIKKFYHYFVPSQGSPGGSFTVEEIRKIDATLGAIDSRLVNVEDAIKRINLTPADSPNTQAVLDDIRQLRMMFANLDRKIADIESYSSNIPTQPAEKDVSDIKDELITLQENLRILENTKWEWKSQLDDLMQKNRQYQLELADVNLRLESLGKSDCNCPPGLIPDGTLSKEMVNKLIMEAISQYDADKTGLPDYALEPAGGSILSIRCTEPYPSKTRETVFFGIPIPFWPRDYSPRTVIQPGLTPGECWAFKGARGYLVIKLSSLIQVTAVSYEHIPKEISPDGQIYSSPKKLEVLALTHELDQNGTSLGTWDYSANGPPLQYFPVQALNASPTEILELHVHSNHGHPQYTCLYRFRVHGKRVNAGWPSFGGS